MAETEGTWPEPVERVSAVLRAAAIDSRVEVFAEDASTARDAARAIGCELDQIVKSLVLVCDGAYVLALVPGSARADTAAIAEAMEASDVRIATADEVVHATGFDPGGVAPFPARAVTQTLMDRGLLGQAVVWVGAGTSSHMAALPPGDLQRLTRARIVDLAARR